MNLRCHLDGLVENFERSRLSGLAWVCRLAFNQCVRLKNLHSIETYNFFFLSHFVMLNYASPLHLDEGVNHTWSCDVFHNKFHSFIVHFFGGKILFSLQNSL